MNIIVCIKQIPDTTEIKLDPETNTLVREGVRSVINPYDLFAIEEGLRLREKHGGKVTVITMGPPQAKKALQQAMSMGADSAKLISSRKFAGSDTWATSYVLSMAVKKLSPFDLVICGKQALDGDTAQVGPGIAAYLKIPQITYVKKIESIDNNEIVAERMTETGYDVIKTKLPAVLTVVKEINIPRYESFEGKIKAHRAIIETWNETDLSCDIKNLGLDASPTQVVKTFPPHVRKLGTVLNESDENIKLVGEKILEFIK